MSPFLPLEKDEEKLKDFVLDKMPELKRTRRFDHRMLDDEEEVQLTEVPFSRQNTAIIVDNNDVGIKRKFENALSDIDDDDLFDDNYSIILPEVSLTNRSTGNKKSQGKMSTKWCFTWNNPSISGEEFKDYLESKSDIKCFVFQKEKGENGTIHFQGYLETGKRMYTTGYQALMGNYKMSALHGKGTRKQNEVYCTKEGRLAGPWYGNKEMFSKKGQGDRKDLDDFARMVVANNGITEEVYDLMPGYALRFEGHANKLVANMKRRKAQDEEMAYWQRQATLEDEGKPIEGQQQRNLELFFGPTAVGKTTLIKMEVLGRKKESLYTKDCTNKWWCGYDGENHVLMDEFKGKDFSSIEQFNAISNKGCQQVETKGGQTILIADNMYFASNRHPCHWWTKGDNMVGWSDARYRAVARRFAKVTWWNDAKEKTVLLNPGVEEDTEEYRKNNLAWKKFWEWKNRPIEEGDSSSPGENNYFTI